MSFLIFSPPVMASLTQTVGTFAITMISSAVQTASMVSALISL
ncbi:MAG: hypothetical protein P8J31_10785 [Luminiphilus sp.]|nr:hypothetical protein [Luminiphilus sp.]